MKNMNLIVILLAMFSITLLSGCTPTQTIDDEPQTCSIDQIEAEEICE